jgi:ATP-dependent RNA helicase DHX34
LESPYGDPITLMNLFSEWLKVKAEKRESSKNWCRRFGVEEQRLYEIVKLKTQFEGVLVEYLGVQTGGEEELSSDDEYEGGIVIRKRKRGRDSVRPDDGQQKMFWKVMFYILIKIVC